MSLAVCRSLWRLIKVRFLSVHTKTSKVDIKVTEINLVST